MSTIRLSKSVVGSEEKRAVLDVLDAGYLGMGSEVQAFENDLRAYLGTDKEVICVSTGTAAMHLSALALGLKSGDEVIIPSITYVASFQAIAATGATPVACDVSESRVFIDLNDASKRLSSKTRAIMPVHYASDSQEMDSVYKFAEKYGLRVIEDAAHGFGCIRNRALVGQHGDVICFSFDGIKNITSGEGGAVVTGDVQLARKIKDGRLLGVEKDTEKRYEGARSWQFNVNDVGLRYHMSNIMAAIGRAQLRKVDEFGTKRRNCVERYLAELRNIRAFRFLDLDYKNIIPHIFVLRVIDGSRERLAGWLNKNGIETGFHYMPNHKLSRFSIDYELTTADRLANELLTLPLHPDLTGKDLDLIINCVNAFYKKSALS